MSALLIATCKLQAAFDGYLSKHTKEKASFSVPNKYILGSNDTTFAAALKAVGDKNESIEIHTDKATVKISLKDASSYFGTSSLIHVLRSTIEGINEIEAQEKEKQKKQEEIAQLDAEIAQLNKKKEALKNDDTKVSENTCNNNYYSRSKYSPQPFSWDLDSDD